MSVPAFAAIVTIEGPHCNGRRVVHVVGPHDSREAARAAGDEIAKAMRMFAPVGADEHVDVSVHQLVKNFAAIAELLA